MERVAQVSPDAASALGELLDAAWTSTDPALLERARARMAALLGCPPDVGARGIAVAPALGARERACLAFAEQFVLDANGVRDADVAALTAELGVPGCYAFVQAVSVMETYLRAWMTLSAVLS